jgi:CRP/FNR family transcriptional regulator, cyclic AMP receptor protein
VHEPTLKFATGCCLIRQGEVETHAFIIESGSVKISIQDGNHEQILGIAGTGEVIGEMALFEDAPRSASVIAVEPTHVQKMSRERLQQLMQKDPAASVPYLKAILERLRTSNTMLAAAQQTKELIKTLRVKLSFEPISHAAVQLSQKKTVIEFDLESDKATTQILTQGFREHYKIEIESFLPHMQR